MALTRDLSAAQLTFQIAEGPIDQYQVIRYRGAEGLCQLYRFEIELAADETSFEFDAIVGKPACLSISAATGLRWFHGVVSRFELTGETTNQLYFRAELVPSMWLLTHRYNSRIFQGKTVKEIITDVLTLGGIPADRFELNFEAGDPIEYCVQYRETDYNFISRLMEEAGTWWHFRQTEESHTFVACDKKDAYTPLEGSAALTYGSPSGLNVEEEHVYRFRLSQSVRPGAVRLTDFDFKNPSLDLAARASVSEGGSAELRKGLEFSDYPGEYLAQSAGTSTAKKRVEEFETGRTIGVGRSNSARLAPGKTFELTDHPSEPTNRSYLITGVVHQGKQSALRGVSGAGDYAGMLGSDTEHALLQASQSDDRVIKGLAATLIKIIARIKSGDQTAHRDLTGWVYHAGQVSRDLAGVAQATGSNALDAVSIRNLLDDVENSGIMAEEVDIYECRFECIPAEVVYRPARVTPWPVMRGCQTARVVGPSGEEIYTDEFGRVKVQFNWDREGGHKETASCWIRVSQGMAGGNYGMMFLPRIGQEVIVDFLEGNPDQPVIVGRVYNADHMPPYKLPDEKTKSVIKTRSSTGGGGTNEIRFEDLKDKEQLFIQAQRMMDTRVKASHMHTIGGSYHLDVGGEKDGELHGEYRQLIYEAKQTHVKGEERTWIEKDESHQVDGMVSIKVGGTLSTNVGSDVVDKFGAGHKHEVKMTYALKALSVKIEASTGIELKCGGSSIVLTPAAIFIVGGPLVNINSGSGPPVTAPTAQATSPTKAEDPSVADSSEPGKDTTYSGGDELVEGETPDPVPGHEFEPIEHEETETSWIDLELLDEEGLPVAGEKYLVIDSAGNEKKGTLDANGKAHVIVVPGECEVFYPDLDAEAWERT